MGNPNIVTNKKGNITEIRIVIYREDIVQQARSEDKVLTYQEINDVMSLVYNDYEIDWGMISHSISRAISERKKQ